MDIFEKHCRCIKDLIINGQVIPQVINNGIMAFRYRNEVIEKIIEQQKFNKGDFLGDLNINIPKYVMAVLTNGFDMLINFGSTKAKKDEDEIRRKVNIVEKYFVNHELISTFKIKSLSKNDVIKYIDWDISKKVYDCEDGTIDNIKYASLNIELASSNEELPFVLMLGGRNKDKQHVVTLTKCDIDYLLMELTEIRKVLSNE